LNSAFEVGLLYSAIFQVYWNADDADFYD